MKFLDDIVKDITIRCVACSVTQQLAQQIFVDYTF